MVRNSICIAMLALALCATVASADVLELNDGRVLEGVVISEGGGKVVFEVHRYGMKAEMAFRASEVKKLTRKPLEKQEEPEEPEKVQPVRRAPVVVQPPEEETETIPEGPTYLVIPLSGVVGKEIVAGEIEKALKVGLIREDTVIVLEMDSPGGMVSECEEIVKLLGNYRDRRSIAYIKSAYSAAAIISLTCDEIYMDRDASIGAATAYARTAFGASDVGEKFQSVWRAICRRAAAIGGHNPLLAEAMVDRNMQLIVVEKDGKKQVQQTLKLKDEDLRQGRVISKQGKLLTMTAPEAVKCGLARAVVTSFEEALAKAEMKDHHSVGDKGRELMDEVTASAKEAEKEIKKCRDNAEKAFRLAQANAPMYATSKRDFLRASKRCYDYLKHCERFLKKIEDYAERHPIYESDAEWAKEQAKEVNRIRMMIKARAKSIM
jgi:hypothetical protein